MTELPSEIPGTVRFRPSFEIQALQVPTKLMFIKSAEFLRRVKILFNAAGEQVLPSGTTAPLLKTTL